MPYVGRWGWCRGGGGGGEWVEWEGGGGGERTRGVGLPRWADSGSPGARRCRRGQCRAVPLTHWTLVCCALVTAACRPALASAPPHFPPPCWRTHAHPLPSPPPALPPPPAPPSPDAVALTPSSPLAGAVYFITNDDARPFWGFLGDLVAPLGYPRPRVRLPLWLVWALAAAVEAAAALLSPLGVRWETDFTRARLVLAARERRVSCAAARRDFGYVPEVGVDEAVRRTVAHFEALRAK